MNKYRNILSNWKQYLLNADGLLLNKTDWSDVNVVIVVSTGRTGTKFIAHFFNEYVNNFFSIHEPFPKIDLLAAKYYQQKIDYNRVIRKVRTKRQFMRRKLFVKNLNNYLESNPAFWSLIPVIREVFPNLKIINLVRDGRTWLRSAYSRKFDAKGNYRRDQYGLIWKFNADDIPKDPYYGKWHQMSIIEKFAWVWRTKNKTIMNAIKDDPNAITVRFEDLFFEENNYNGIKEIVKFISEDYYLNIELNDIASPLKNKVNSTSKFLIPEYAQWSDQQKSSFGKVAGDMMYKLGYF